MGITPIPLFDQVNFLDLSDIRKNGTLHCLALHRGESGLDV